jgi:beta-N-acetylhexosaminidase
MAVEPSEVRRRRRAELARGAARRRRALILLMLAGLAAASFALGTITSARDDASTTSQASAEVPFPLVPLPGLKPAQLAGQRLVAGFEGTRPPRGLVRAIRGGRLAGVVLFEDNIRGPAAAGRLVAELQAIPRPDGLEAPLAVMVDQEGGQVKRIDGPPSVSAEEMGRRGRTYSATQGAATARLLRRSGVNVDLAPVVDVGRRGSAISGEHRSFGGSAAAVVETALVGFAGGLRSGGVAATAKHFPGFGAARVNTDVASQRIDLSRARLRAVDEVPFAAFARSGGELAMLSLASYPAFGDRPAAFDRAIATRELRDRLGFEGVSITDSLDAEAATSFGSRGAVATAAAGAGSDLLLYGSWRTAAKANAALRHGLARGTLDRGEFEAAARRVLSLRAELAG